MRPESPKLIFISLLIILLSAVGPASAQDSEKAGFEPYYLGELLVSADRPDDREVVIHDIVTEEQVRATNSTTVAEALAFAPGVLVTTNRRNEPQVQIYGLAQEKAAILIDGVPYYETKYHRLNLDQIPADIISRIEIIKGASSVLYGPNALAGVINVVTKKAASEKPSFMLIGEAGEHGTYRAGVSHGMKVGNWNYFLNYTRRASDGWRMSGDYAPEMGGIVYKPGGTEEALLEDGGYRNNSDYRVDSIWSRVGYESDDGEYFANFHWINADRGMPPNISSEMVFTSRPAFSRLSRWEDYDDMGVDLSGRQALSEKLTLKGKLFYHNHEDLYVSYSDANFTDAIAHSRYKDYFAGGNLTAEYNVLDGHMLAAAFHFKGDSHKERDDEYLPYAESFSYTGSSGIEYRFTAVPGLMVVAGMGYDWYQVDRAEENLTDKDGNLTEQQDLDTPGTKSEWNPMIGASYTFSDTTRIFGSVGRKTRFPTLQELYSTKGGNPELEAETSINYNLGVGRRFFDQIDIQLAGFYMDISDWISRDGPNNPTSQFQNYGKVHLYGMEAGLVWSPLKELIFRLDYTYTVARDESDDRATDKVLRVPEHKLDVGASYLIPLVLTKLDLQGLAVGERYDQLPTPANPDLEEEKTDAYFILNARVSREFFEYFEAYAGVNNIFDKDYESEVDFPGPGREWRIGLIARF